MDSRLARATNHFVLACVAGLHLAIFTGLALAVAPYPHSTLIDRITWDFASHDERAPGSDN